MLDRRITDATDDEVLQYRAGGVEPYRSSVEMEFSSIDELTSVLDFVAESLFAQKRQFVTAVQESRSSDAIFHADTFRVLLKLQSDLLANLQEAGRSQEWIDSLPQYPRSGR